MATDAGDVQAFQVSISGAVETVDILPGRLPPGIPPLVRLDEDRASLTTSEADAISTLTHPVMLSRSGRLVTIDESGDLIVESPPGAIRLGVAALPNARLLVDEHERLLVLTGPTRRLSHELVGDPIEAEGVTLVDTRRGGGQVVASFEIANDAVIEGIAPIWADLTGDGQREIIVTVSDTSEGAQIVVFSESGSRTQTARPLGRAADGGTSWPSRPSALAARWKSRKSSRRTSVESSASTG